MRIGMVFMLAFLCVASASAQTDIEEMYLRRAISDFVAKNFDESIANLDQVLAANNQNMKARKLLSKCYVKKGAAMVDANQPQEASRFFGKALEYDPDNQDAQVAVEQNRRAAAQSVLSSGTSPAPMIAPQSFPQQPSASVAQQQPQPVQYAPQAPATPIVINNPGAPAGADNGQSKVIMELLATFSKQQDVIVQQAQTTQSQSNKHESDKDQYLAAAMQMSERNSKGMIRFVVIVVVVGIVVVLTIVGFFIMLFLKFIKSSELKTVQTTETLVKLLAAPGSAGPQNAPLMLSGPMPSAGPQEIRATMETSAVASLETADPVKRAQAVEAVAAEIVGPREMQRLEKIKKIEHLLHDENNRVRANAAKALYEIDKDASLSTLNDMISSDSMRMRASAIWALGEIGSEEALTFVLGVDNNNDEIVKYNVKVALEKIKSAARFPLDKEQVEMIDATLDNFKEMV